MDIKTKIAKAYPDFEGYCNYDYDKLIGIIFEDCHIAIAIRTSFDGGYHGDLYYLLFSDNAWSNNIRWIISAVGYGSCSGCDALQACESMEELEVLAQNIYNDAEKFETNKEAIAYVENLKNKGNKAKWFQSEENFLEFAELVERYIKLHAKSYLG